MKKKISQFEFAIMQIASPKDAENHEPYTDSEELNIRRNKIRKQMDRFKILNEGISKV